MPLTATMAPARTAVTALASAAWLATTVSLPGSLELQLWPAVGAGDRFGVEAPVSWIAVFGFALRAQWETRHARILAVVGQRFDQRVAGPALRAVNKWIGVASVRRVLQLVLAVVAHEVVGRHENLSVRIGKALDDPEGIAVELARRFDAQDGR